MFGIFSSEQSRARRDARNWLHLARKIYHFRRDQLPPPETQALLQAENELRIRLREHADAARLKMAIERLESCLRRSGGTFYPKSALVDNVEFFLVALILFLGFRAFIAQPFKIPTNSMWPSYYGMTAEVYPGPEKEPGPLKRLFRFVAFGATSRRIDAPVSGDLRIACAVTGEPLVEEVSQRRWLVLPGKAWRYTLLVGNQAVPVTVPADFRLERVFEDAFFSHGRTREQSVLEARASHRWAERWIPGAGRSVTVLEVPTGRHVEAGERILSFDILTGDQLFVDRISYHFVRPKVGDGFVFRTGHIPYIELGGPASVNKYYIKRLVGVPGDVLQIRAPVLYRNGAPITGAEAFELNAHRTGLYPGYTYRGSLQKGETVTVPPGRFFAMGDNSPDSSDSRVWGFVPAGDVVGRPLFIYYPFTRRWGPAH